MKSSCIIIEDEPLAMERTRDYVQRLPQLELLGCFNSGLKALTYLKTNQVDLIFLDVNMDELSGIELLESSSIPSSVILTTAYDQYALKGYDLNVTDFLLKPFTFARFVQAVEKVHDRSVKLSLPPDRRFIFVKTEYRLEKILLGDILYIEGMRDYRRIHTTRKKIMTLQTFKEFENDLPANQIGRVHKSYMVAFDRIDSIERDRIRIGDVMIPISETYRKNFLEKIYRQAKH